MSEMDVLSHIQASKPKVAFRARKSIMGFLHQPENVSNMISGSSTVIVAWLGLA